jgi:hypothetical protein
MFERKHDKLAPVPVFARRMANYIGIVVLLIVSALIIGIIGYHSLAGLGWVDSLLNASMILSGMGPVSTLTSPASKVFASFYALFSGLVFIAVMGIALTPIFHRVIHKFHMDDNEAGSRKAGK